MSSLYNPEQFLSRLPHLPKDKPAAVVFNAHITGLAVTRALGRENIPVLALDRDARAYGLASKYLHSAAICPNPLTNEEDFVDFLLQMGERLPVKAVLFPSNDEWVFAVSRHRDRLEKYYHFPFSPLEIVESVLNKKKLYQTAERLGVPIPKTWYPDEWMDIEAEAKKVTYPCILKPVEQRSFYDAFSAKVLEAHTPNEVIQLLKKVYPHSVVIQEIVPAGLSNYVSLCSYMRSNGEMVAGFVGRKLEQYPPDFGTGCLVKSEDLPDLAELGANILRTLAYYGISESEFILDHRDGVYKLLDINTRTWKWIGLPIACGWNLPLYAYEEANGSPLTLPVSPTRKGMRWVYLKDYLTLKASGKYVSPQEHLHVHELAELLTGTSETCLDAVLDLDDPVPAARLLENFYTRSYVCPC